MPDNVKQAAARFRTALEQGGLEHVTFKLFPRGCCGDTCELLGQYLRDCGFGAWTYRFGLLEGSSHAWLEQDGTIVDITADQFGEVYPAVLVTSHSPWHDRMALAAGRRYAGLGYYDPRPDGDPLRADYRTLFGRAEALRLEGEAE